jgi:hypothetical protein
VIVHGYRGQPGTIDFTAELDGDDIVVTIEDRAPTFDPTTVPTPDLSIPPQHRRPRTGALRIANAGHEPPLLVPGDGGPIRQIEGGGPLLGAFGALGLGESEVTLERGDLWCSTRSA